MYFLWKRLGGAPLNPLPHLHILHVCFYMVLIRRGYFFKMLFQNKPTISPALPFSDVKRIEMYVCRSTSLVGQLLRPQVAQREIITVTTRVLLPVPATL